MKLHFATAGNPAFGFNPDHHARRPQRLRIAQGLHFAIRVGIRGFHYQFLGFVALGDFFQFEFASAVFIQRHGQFIGDDFFIDRGFGRFLVAHLRGAVFARWIEIEPREIGIIHVLFAHQGRYAHGQIRRTAAGNVVHLHINGQRIQPDQRLFLRRRDTTF